MKFTFLNLMCMAAVTCCVSVGRAYEINNHADMSQTAANKSALAALNPAGTKIPLLERLGLKSFPAALNDSRQTFPLDPALGPIPYCFGSERPEPFAVIINDPTKFPPQQDTSIAVPTWGTNNQRTQLTIAQFFRYGACFEDSESPDKKPLSHFYDPQHQGAAGLGGASSLEWILKRGVGNALTGQNHYTWQDARENFYNALTRNPSGLNPGANEQARRFYWGATFQSLGHIVHHL